ncbi:response regulator transcription factor [Azospirillum sp. CT11-132]|jgi:DNA-binding response OmpR family regulator|uniref:response regulator transcription factor n=1 Tax=unclassified Azospirillum TaxID=2630922 RepID=UPI000D617801|nr:MULTISPECIES: response regulator transcription factor [unclassified Azospirillum]PWC59886.1 response regulator [Azospirillum sp. TSH20]PWC68779.1 response regulator [Azospirillum sp. TSH7]QCG98482.1 response regulator transcription factor [Azospirillum sp. TSA2s]
MAGPTIVVVEDENSLRSDMVEYLSSCGFDAIGARDGAELDRLLRNRNAAIIILDVNLPDEDGFKIAARLRDSHGAGIIMVTARSSTVDRVVGLEIGADAYLVKPVELRELEAQVKSLLRRLSERAAETAIQAANGTAGGEAGDSADEARWSLDPTEWSLTNPAGIRISLTSMEMKLTSLLAAQARKPATRDQISQALYNRRWNPEDRSIDTVVGRLRHKVEGAIGGPAPLKSVHGVGYVFSAPIRVVGAAQG